MKQFCIRFAIILSVFMFSGRDAFCATAADIENLRVKYEAILKAELQDSAAAIAELNQLAERFKTELTAPAKAATADAECSAPKRWRSLNGQFSYLGAGIHQPETRGQHAATISQFEKLCNQNGGQMQINEKELKDLKNKCGEYNKYDEYLCYFGPSATNDQTCARVFGKSGLNYTQGGSDGKYFSGCQLN